MRVPPTGTARFWPFRSVTEPDPEIDAAQVGEAFEGNPRSIARPYLTDVHCRLALLRSQCGLVTKDIGAYMYELLGRVNPVIEIPEAGHHLMLDQPLLLITALNTLLADWDHSEPRKRSV